MSSDDYLANEIIVERRSECPVTTAIGIIAGKWKPTILCEIREGPRRFSDLRRDIPGISGALTASARSRGRRHRCAARIS
jgi:DNA-binding HxlR family transcriptional regulator